MLYINLQFSNFFIDLYYSNISLYNLKNKTYIRYYIIFKYFDYLLFLVDKKSILSD